MMEGGKRVGGGTRGRAEEAARAPPPPPRLPAGGKTLRVKEEKGGGGQAKIRRKRQKAAMGKGGGTLPAGRGKRVTPHTHIFHHRHPPPRRVLRGELRTVRGGGGAELFVQHRRGHGAARAGPPPACGAGRAARSTSAVK